MEGIKPANDRQLALFFQIPLQIGFVFSTSFSAPTVPGANWNWLWLVRRFLVGTESSGGLALLFLTAIPLNVFVIPY